MFKMCLVQVSDRGPVSGWHYVIFKAREFVPVSSSEGETGSWCFTITPARCSKRGASRMDSVTTFSPRHPARHSNPSALPRLGRTVQWRLSSCPTDKQLLQARTTHAATCYSSKCGSTG
jgi:hypothetical protein